MTHRIMKPSLRVLFFLSGTRNKASSRVRGFWIAEEFSRLGMQCAVVYGRRKSAFLKMMSKIPYYDFIYFQKRFTPWDYRLMRLANRMGKYTLFDLDDAPFGLRKDTEKHVTLMMKNASAVVVGSRNLLKFASQYQKNSFLVPTSVNLKHYETAMPKKARSHKCLGWIGHGKVYYNDLIKILQEPLTNLATRHKIRLKLIGTCNQREIYQSFTNIPGLETIFIDNLDWTNHMEIRKQMHDFDIGLFPLLATNYNLYKCGFKALEYMAMEIPVVASPVGANNDIVSQGVDGYLADNPNEWTSVLSSLITNQAVREKMGKAGRLKVKNQYNLPVIAHQLSNVLTSLK